MASSGAMMALTFLFTIPQFLATGTAPCKKETRSSLRLFRDRKVRKPQTSRGMAAEARSTHLAGRTRPLPAFFCLEPGGGAEDLTGDAAFRTFRARGHCVNGAYSISLAPPDKLWDGWVLRRRRRRLPPTQPPRRDRPRCCVLNHKSRTNSNRNISLTLRRFPRSLPRRRRHREKHCGGDGSC